MGNRAAPVGSRHINDPSDVGARENFTISVIMRRASGLVELWSGVSDSASQKLSPGSRTTRLERVHPLLSHNNDSVKVRMASVLL